MLPLIDNYIQLQIWAWNIKTFLFSYLSDFVKAMGSWNSKSSLESCRLSENKKYENGESILGFLHACGMHISLVKCFVI